ncbi:sulfatase-like hydrolase/transferase [Lewinella sp. JB7]|uniref:sulfatase-like hydrolase/transferase n=1 Tax=Lewinella sp. JB7 TaxID=2962887 RepID=UPI0020CA06C7|nr:sulfatase-like hydrolase/transferase [Lewinella sp. JB7]MCP9236670.1 sulfatase-like hydrolase/transferase [Lewinella sp. JB7]
MLRTFLASLFLLFSFSAFTQVAGGGAREQGNSERPNVLWLTIEDTSPQFIGAYGNTDVHTPNIDRLAAEGIRFDRAFAPAPVCAIARNALITGMSPDKLGTGNHRSAYPVPEFIRGYPAYLRDRGYYTTNNAKTDYNTSRADAIIAESWDESSNKAGWWDRAPGQPFFSVFNFAESHQSRTMTQPRPWYEKNVLAHLPDSLRTRASELEMLPVYRDSPEMREHVARVYNSINLMDLRIGEMLDRLEADGLTDSTIIFVYADHGEAVPGGKATASGLGYRVPFLIWFPEVYRHLSPWKSGSVSQELLTFLDLGPTLISLTGGDIPEYMDGRAALGGAREPAPEYIFAGRNRLDETPDLARSVTDGRYLYTRNFFPQYPAQKPQKYADVSDIVQAIRADDRAGLLSEPQSRILRPQPAETLFDLQSDPWERHNLIDDPAYADRARRMREAVREEILAERDVHFLPEVALAKLPMPYTFRQDRENYPLSEALEVALIDPVTAKGQRKLIRALGDKRQLVRYWAAVVLGRVPPSPNAVAGLRTALNDEHFTVAIYAAGALVRHTDDAGAAAELLRTHALGEEPYRALSALQQMQYAGPAMRDFLPDFRAKLKQLDAEPGADKNMAYNLRSIVETSIFLLGEGPKLAY